MKSRTTIHRRSWIGGVGALRGFTLALVLLLLGGGLPAADGPTPEYRLKAALIYKLARFVAWPRPLAEGRAFDICLLGRDDFGSALDALARRRIDGHPVHIRRFQQSEAVSPDCRILFISSSKRPFLKEILARLADRPLLTVGDMPGFARAGGMIELARGDHRIVFYINNQRAQAAGLRIAAPLLELARVVESS